MHARKAHCWQLNVVYVGSIYVQVWWQYFHYFHYFSFMQFVVTHFWVPTNKKKEFEQCRFDTVPQPEAPRRWSRTSTVAPNGRPAAACPAPMHNGKKPHSLGSINSTQHSSTREGENEKKTEERGILEGWERALLKLKREGEFERKRKEEEGNTGGQDR